MTSLQSFVVGDVLFLTGLALFFLIVYWAGRADILRRVWKRVRGRERVKFTLKKIVYEGEAVPRFYGFGYIDWPRLEKTAYPVPLNLFVRYGRVLWYWLEFLLRARRATWIDRKLGEAYRKGMDEGQKSYQAGYEKGHNDGFADGRTILLHDLKKAIGRILSDGFDPEPELVYATLINAIRDKANDDNPPQ